MIENPHLDFEWVEIKEKKVKTEKPKKEEKKIKVKAKDIFKKDNLLETKKK
ncbi:MAG: hypothetical protein GY849_02330 [Deltaproteobacteria bacterium]|nr:hypothetical protein [Deltaproteobacteria bacterium]